MSEEVFDNIVIGAGSAGCVLANRLSADPKRRVLLLEAGGPDRNVWIHIPAGYYRNIFNPKLSWGYETEPEPELDGRRITWPRGKVLGGSSAINGLVYIRGQKEDYEQWRQLGNRGWGYDDVLPYFLKAERQERGADAYHGDQGPLGVTDLRMRHPLCEAFAAAARNAGFPANDDFNRDSQEGVGYYQLTEWNGRRSSTAVCYLDPVKSRPNLEIRTRAQVAQVLIEEDRATGVVYARGGKREEVRCRGEIVLSGGAINSPQVLQLSGIGPGALLREHGIPVVRDLPGVGGNLIDHMQVRAVYCCNQPLSFNDDLRSWPRKAAMLFEYLTKRSGPMTVGAGQVGLFARSGPEVATPDIQFHFMTVSVERPGEKLHDFSGFTSSICQLRPESRGTIQIRSADPMDKPAIRANYFSTETDRRVTVAGMRLARKIAETAPLSDLIESEFIPGPDVQSDEEMVAAARQHANTIFHPVGTCKMGDDPLAVVDDRLRVHGIAGLRVADCAIMPTIVSGNTNAGAIMIGEKCAEMMLEDSAG